MPKLLSRGVKGWHFNKKDEGGLLELKDSGIAHTGAHSAPDIAVHDRVYERGQHTLTLRVTRVSTGRKGVITREACPRTCIGVTDAGPPYGGLEQAGTTMYLGDKESIYMSYAGFPARDGDNVGKLNFSSSLSEHPDEIIIFGVRPARDAYCAVGYNVRLSVAAMAVAVDMENRIVGFTGKANTSMGVKWADRKDVPLPFGVQALRLCLRLWYPGTQVQLVSIDSSQSESGDGGGNSESDARSNNGGYEGGGDGCCRIGSDEINVVSGSEETGGFGNGGGGDSGGGSGGGGSVAIMRSGKRKRTSVTEAIEFEIPPGQQEVCFEVPHGAKRGKAVLTFTF